MNLFYSDPGKIQNNTVIITGQEAEHITKVLRHSVGDTVKVTDGKGNCFDCEIKDFQKSTVFLEISGTEREVISPPAVCLCLGIIKKRDRLEFAVEKSIELGVTKVILFNGEHSQKSNVREDRLEKTAISAMKQSLRFYLPEIIVENSLQDAIENNGKDSKVIVADETTEKGEENHKQSKNYFLVVGPEGGFSKGERKYLKTINPIYYSLGKKRLRTETAAVVMVDRYANLK